MKLLYVYIVILLLLLLLLLGPGHIHTPTLQPTHWACINSVMTSTQSSVCAGGNDTHAYTGKGVSENHNNKMQLTPKKNKLDIVILIDLFIL